MTDSAAVDVSRRRSIARTAAVEGADRALETFRSELDVETKTGPTDVVTETDRAVQRRVASIVAEEFPDEPLIGEELDARRTVPDRGPAWVVDPIDGTANFVRGGRYWATVVAAVVDGEPVAAAIAAPALGDVYVAGEEVTQRNGEPVSVSDVDSPAGAAICPTLRWPERTAADLDDGSSSAAAGGTTFDDLARQFGSVRRVGAAQLELANVADGTFDATVAGLHGSPWDTIAGAHLVRQAGGRVTDPDDRHWQHDDAGIVASNGALHDAALEVVTPD